MNDFEHWRAAYLAALQGLCAAIGNCEIDEEEDVDCTISRRACEIANLAMTDLSSKEKELL